MYFRNRKQLTQRLSGSGYALTIPGKRNTMLWVLVCALLLSLGAYLWLQSRPSDVDMHAQAHDLQREVQRLQQELKLGEMRLQQEILTREQLAIQLDEQSQKLRQREQELQFFRSQKEKTAREKTDSSIN